MHFGFSDGFQNKEVECTLKDVGRYGSQRNLLSGADMSIDVAHPTVNLMVGCLRSQGRDFGPEGAEIEF